jgi:hypothetical protein
VALVEMRSSTECRSNKMSGSYENTHKRRFIGAVLELCVLVVADDYSFCSQREIK